ncbi:LipL32 family surface lipoprotein [Aquimarina sp. RZ0]|uniref:LipL32 family surface lipoprotein n=1 Tax=Aquimarina sp. RZ0 TaxID=2607730 RepID=UPI0011F3440E|nr:LipL32 family surface lipoprotein [Aquimarina sp. RZ0]KAA1243847.1 hypothetical protein F0000_19345 [Aquimarina sp. RZ0]
MKTTFLTLLVIITLGNTSTTQAQKLKKFKSTITKKIGPKKINIPYLHMTSYLEYTDDNNIGELVDDLRTYSTYIWIPVATTEIGVRMLSPVGKNKIKNAIISEIYTKNSKSMGSLDVFLRFERSDIKNPEDISELTIKNANWQEIYPSGSSLDEDNYNIGNIEVARYLTDTQKPLEALTRGLYKVSFRTYNHEGTKGTFLGQIGFPVKIPGVIIARTIEDLKRGLESK